MFSKSSKWFRNRHKIWKLRLLSCWNSHLTKVGLKPPPPFCTPIGFRYPFTFTVDRVNLLDVHLYIFLKNFTIVWPATVIVTRSKIHWIKSCHMLARRCTLYYLKNCLKQLDFIAQMLSMKQIFFCMLYLLSFSIQKK